jgi:hypothetical protein
MDDDDQIERDFAELGRVRPDVFADLVDDPTQGLPPTEDLVQTGLFSQLEDGLLYLPEGAQEWVSARRSQLTEELDDLLDAADGDGAADEEPPPA